MLFWIAIGLLILAIVGTPIVLFYQIIRDVMKYFLSDWYNKKLPFTNVTPATRSFLAEKFQYYKNLGLADRNIFERRVQKFIDLKNFRGVEGLIITADMRTLVAASAVQLTFGLPSVYLDRFQEIVLYPDVYQSPVTGGFHQGEVHSGGVIVLSWKKLVDGYFNLHDGRNLGLHEMAHALQISDENSAAGFDFLDRTVFHDFIFLAREEMRIIASGEPSLFRKYAAANDHEFFAIAIETFFEKPLAFNDFHPLMYATLARLLNQDPLKGSEKKKILSH